MDTDTETYKDQMDTNIETQIQNPKTSKEKKWTSEEERELSNAFGMQIQSKSNIKQAISEMLRKKSNF